MNSMLIALFITLAVLLLYYIIQPSEGVVQLESKSIREQQNHSFIAKLTGNNVVLPVNTNSKGIAKFQANDPNNNELSYEINLTNMHNDIARVEVHLGKETENGRSIVTLYQTTISLPSEICCRSAASESERSKFLFNGTISPQSLELGPLAGSKNITDLVRLFYTGNAYVEVYTFNPKSLSLLNGDSEIRGQIMPLPSNYTTITKLQ
jgi:CHRD domain-containing protein